MNQKLTEYIIADTNFLSKKIKDSIKFVSVFPEKLKDGAYRSDYNSLKKRGEILSKFYNDNLKYLLLFYNKNVLNSSQNISVLLRPALVLLTNVYLDRSIRVLHLLDKKRNNLKIVDIDIVYKFKSLDQINSLLTYNWELNHSICLFISKALGIEAKKIIHKKDYPFYNTESAHGSDFVNTLFWPPRKEGFFDLLKFYKTKLLRRLLLFNKSFFSKFSSLGFSTDDTYFTLKGFYFPFGLFERQKIFDWVECNRNENLRNELNNFLQTNFSKSFYKLITNATSNKFADQDYLKVSASYTNFLTNFFPEYFLEGLNLNLKQASLLRNCNKLPHIVGTDAVRDKDLFYAAITKQNNGKIIGFQHGGHYGYVASNSLHAEFEYSHYDIFLTYGWSEWDKELPKSNILIPTVSPRLSELKTQNWLINKKKPMVNNNKNILFFLNVFHRFPHASTLCQARIDFNDEILQNLENTFELLIQNKIKIDIKKYNQHSIDLRYDFYEKIIKKGNGMINFINIHQKGLSYNLLKNYNLVLWDQIGTGTLDCLVAKIPTIILWKRIYSNESKAAKKLILDLEKYGVLHNNHFTFVNEIKKYQNNPQIWMENENRIKAISNFCAKYARTSENWKNIWKKNLKSIYKSND